MGGQTRAARGRDRGGGRPDAEALQDGGGIAAAGRRTAASRRGPTRRQLADSPGIPHLVTYRLRFALWLGLAPSHLPGGPPGGVMKPIGSVRAPFQKGGGVVCSMVRTASC